MSVDWNALLEHDQEVWRQAKQTGSQGKPFVLICSSIGSHGPVVTHDSFLAATLTARGAHVEILLCDGALPACEACTWYGLKPAPMIEAGPQAGLCAPCFQHGVATFAPLGLPIQRYSSFLMEEDYAFARAVVKTIPDAAIKTYELDGVALGEEAYAGALRYFAVGDLENEAEGIAILRRYLEGSIVALRVVQRVLHTCKPDVIVFHHGIYVPQGVLGRVARQLGIRVVNWAVGYRKQTFVYSHDDTYHRTMIDEPVEVWKERKLTPEEVHHLNRYLDSRKNNAQDWIKFNQEPEENRRFIQKKIGLDARPMILLLTNVTWDAQLYYKNNGFPSLLDWLQYSIEYFNDRQDVQLVIRVHPSEVRGTMPTRQPVMQEIRRRMGTLPPNVYVVEAESDISTYALADMADCAIIYGTKTGVELTARGIPVIVAGEAWIRNKGLTIDVSTPEEYVDCLNRLPLKRRMSDEQVSLALQYAFHYFFRRLIPVKGLVHAQSTQNLVGKIRRRVERTVRGGTPAVISSPYTVQLDSLVDLQPGRDKGLDVICNGILHGTPFIYDQPADRNADAG